MMVCLLKVGCCGFVIISTKIFLKDTGINRQALKKLSFKIAGGTCEVEGTQNGPKIILLG